MDVLNISTLSDRRKELCIRFALKTSNNPKFKNWFGPVKKVIRTSKKYYEPQARTSAYLKSPILYLTTLLNDN